MKRALPLIASTAALGLALSACGGGSDPLAAGGGDHGETIAIGSQAYYSNEIVAEIYAQRLESAGLTVDRQFQIGQREVYMPEVESGSLDVIPEYTGSLLQYLDDSATASTPEEIEEALGTALPDDLRALSAAAAADQDSFVVTRDFAEEHDLSTVADLANVDEDLTIVANSEFETRPYGPEGLSDVYGVEVTVLPVEDSGGPLTIKALTDGDAQIADIYSANPVIEANDFVVLEDPESLVLPQNVVPIVSEKIDADAEALLDEVQAALTQDELLALNTRSVDEQAAAAVIASDWLAEQGLD